MPLKPLSRSHAEPGGAQAHHLHDTGLELTGVTRRRPHQQASCCHLLCLPSQLLRQVFDSSPAILAVSPFAMERQLYSLATHGATSYAIFPLKLEGNLP